MSFVAESGETEVTGYALLLPLMTSGRWMPAGGRWGDVVVVCRGERRTDVTGHALPLDDLGKVDTGWRPMGRCSCRLSRRAENREPR